MALTLEWQHRIDRWREELPRHVYRPLGSVSFAGFTTRRQLTAAQAAQERFEPMPPGTAWGAKWEYGWFKGTVTLPEEATGQRIVLAPNLGGESLVYVNGRAAGAIDQQHHHVTLSTEGTPGTDYAVLIETYAGHGPRVVHAGPTPPDRETVPEPGPKQTTVGESTFGIWQEDVYQLWIDVETLYGIREAIDPDSLRVAEIDQALRDFTIIVDFELPREAMLETIHACRERLQPLLACVNGSTAPTMFAFGHAHLDVAWLWPLAETERKIARTFATQLALTEAYPEFRFLQSQPHLYWMLKTRYPELYERVKAAVERGQVIAEGATWVEPDMNVPSGESLIRQFVHGKRFFREAFGVECRMLWLPDVFGYSGALPQIMRGCEVPYFSTHKIFWAYHGGAPFPYNTFIWEGIDGSEVYVHLHRNYLSETRPGDLIERWRQRVQKDGIATRLFPFGWGDGGGGPTRDHLEFLRREEDLEGVPRVRIDSPLAFFEDQMERGWPDERYVGELYFQAHRGTYTTQARTKRGNRQCEVALREAELWSVAARAMAGHAIPMEQLDAAWRTVLLNQFHDIIPGSSIHRVHEEAKTDYARVLETTRQIRQRAQEVLTDDADALTVFNALSWERRALVKLPEEMAAVVDPSGAPLPTQSIQGGAWAEVDLPSCGWTTLRPIPDRKAAPNGPNALRADERALVNELLEITLNERGEIERIRDASTGRDWAAGVCNRFAMYKDVPTSFDAWDIDSMYGQMPVELSEPATVEVVAKGPLVARLRLRRRLHHSMMTQEISLRRGSRRIDFHTTIDWQERHKLLKVDFPVTVHANEAVHEIQFGHIRRPTHASRPFDADRFEVCNQKWTALMEGGRGCAVLNDCKYGVNVLGNSINLTLLRSPLAPDMTADRGKQIFTYAFYAWEGPFIESGLVREAYELNVPVTTARGAGGAASLFSVDAPNVVIETVKPAADGGAAGCSDIVVRLYESHRTATACALITPLPIVEVHQTNMLERVERRLSHQGGAIPLEFGPFEVKTVRLGLG